MSCFSEMGRASWGGGGGGGGNQTINIELLMEERLPQSRYINTTDSELACVHLNAYTLSLPAE